MVAYESSDCSVRTAQLVGARGCMAFLTHWLCGVLASQPTLVVERHMYQEPLNPRKGQAVKLAQLVHRGCTINTVSNACANSHANAAKTSKNRAQVWYGYRLLAESPLLGRQ